MKIFLVYDNLFIEDENYSQIHTEDGVDRMVWGFVALTVVSYSMLMKYVLKGISKTNIIKAN
ncbi:hypothetical protein J6TS2_21100 [Heyndrickxia sporothermodurans]|nr:hypothetical protein J6TS2_21100 [Heyndrickxia sporothermodurans]